MVAVVFGLLKNNMDISTEKFLEQPLVTVITSVYNDAEHLERTIKSVLDQTYKNIEYIVIDGGSTDGTVDVIKKYAGRLAYWVSERDRGMFDGMNKGIDKATGIYTNFMNSGDYFASNTVFEEIFSKPHNSDNLYGGFIFERDGEPYYCEATSENAVINEAWKGQRLVSNALFTKTEILKKHHLDLIFKNSADSDFTLKCVSLGYTFERLLVLVFRVGTKGNSFYNWLPCRLEDWKISRKYFPGLRTDIFFLYSIVYGVSVRKIKEIMPSSLYNFFRDIYRKTLKPGITLKKYGFKKFE